MSKITLVIWGGNWTCPTVGRTRYLAESIAELYEDVQVLYVNSPVQRKIPLRHREFWSVLRKVSRTPVEQHNGVIVLNIPPSPLPYAHHFLLFRMWRATFICNRLRHYSGRDRAVLFIGDPKEWPLARLWWRNEGIVIYDCYDLMPAFQNSGERIARDEVNLVRFASLVTCSAPGLVDHIKSLAPDKPVFLVRNGVHWERFQGNFPTPPNMSSISHPRIGFIGSISYWVDVELIARTAERRPEWNFLLIGPTRVPVPNLPNIHLLPPVPPEKVPYYLHNIDVGIIPFHDTPLTRCVNPVKLYEYLACGKPVVATPYGDFGDVEQWIYFARTPEEFVKAIYNALREDCLDLQQQRRNAACHASWRERSKELLKAIQQVSAVD